MQEDENIDKEITTQEDVVAEQEDEILPEVLLAEEEIEDFAEEQIEAEEKKERENFPIYIIGANPLAYYIGTQLQSIGEKVIILLEHQHSESSLNTDGISIKEDRNLTQKRHRLETSFLMKYPARMVIITAYANNINTALSSVSTKQIDGAPVICFTPLKDINYLQGLLGENLHPAYFNGYLFNSNQAISVFGRSSKIILCPPVGKIIDRDAVSIFKSTSFELDISESSAESFWKYFAPYALCSIFSAAENKKVSELLKDKELKEYFKPLAEEMSSLAASDNVFVNEKVIMRGVYNTPANYIFPLHQAMLNGEKTEFNLLSSVINSAAHKMKLRIPHINSLLKKLYNIILEVA